MEIKSLLFAILTTAQAVMAAPLAVPLRIPYPVEDPACRGDLAVALGKSTHAWYGGTLALAEAGDRSGGLIVMFQGTEIGRLDKGRAAILFAAHPQVESGVRAAPAAAAMAKGPESPATALASGEWARWGEWKQEAVVGYDVDWLYSGVLVRRNKAKAYFRDRFGPIYVGTGAEYASFKGDLADSVPYARKAARFGWEVEIGIPFLRYRVASAPYALPEYFWAERDLEGKYFSPDRGEKVVRVLENGAVPSLEHTLAAKAGPLRYSFILAPGAYKSPLHFAALDGLPAGFGSFGMGALITPDGFIPGLWFQCRDFELARMRFGQSSRSLRFVPGRIAYFRAVRSQFSLAWSGAVAMDL